MTGPGPRGRRAVLPALACALALAACGGAPDPLRAARDALAAELPQPYFEDLVTESARVEGRMLMLLVRSPGGDADRTRGHARFGQLHQSEQAQMYELCALPAVQALSGSDAVLVRRFVDRHDKLFFETVLPARECAPQTMRSAP